MTYGQYQCCFCGKQITNKSPNPCSLAITTGFVLPADKQINQGFFCHIECFEERMHPSTQLYVKKILEQ